MVSGETYFGLLQWFKYICTVIYFFRMSNEQTLISSIEHKVKKLMRLNSELKEENAKLHQNIDNLEEKLRLLSVDLNTKQNELFNISLATTLEKEFGVEESKKKIDSLLTEIERSIEVLSD